MLKELAQRLKQDPKTTVLEILTVIAIFVMGYALLLIGTILN